MTIKEAMQLIYDNIKKLLIMSPLIGIPFLIFFIYTNNFYTSKIILNDVYDEFDNRAQMQSIGNILGLNSARKSSKAMVAKNIGMSHDFLTLAAQAFKDQLTNDSFYTELSSLKSETLRKNLRLTLTSTGLWEFEYKSNDRLLTRDFLEFYYVYLNDYMRSRDVIFAENYINYALEEKKNISNRNLNSQSVSLIENMMNTKYIASIRKDYIFEKLVAAKLDDSSYLLKVFYAGFISLVIGALSSIFIILVIKFKPSEWLDE